MHVCQNPECGKEIANNRKFCDEKCHRRYFELKGEKQSKPITKTLVLYQSNPQVEAVLKYIGIEKQNISKSIAYTHWERFVRFCMENSGKSWNDSIKPRLRSYIGVDSRYLEDYLKACIAWGVVKLEDGNLIFLGIPKEEPINADSE
jgi:predicted nucleic acid-binding Zn ribbon protein